MDDKAPTRTGFGLFQDMVELVARALFGGIAAAVAMALAILALSFAAHATLPVAAAEQAVAHAPWSVAPPQEARTTAPGRGALWATSTVALPAGYEAATRMPRDDASRSLVLAFGLLALLGIASVAFAGRARG